jgi:Na+/glutamate symporter
MAIGIVIGTILGVIIGTVLPIVNERIRPVKKTPMSDKEKQKQKELRKSFDELMNYDYQTAMRGDK